MKFPLFNLDIFKRSSSPSSTPTNRLTTTIGKRKSSAPHRTKSGSSHRRTSRKRSITYYSPSKSRFYPTEYFPTLQRAPSTVSTHVAPATCDAKLNHNRSYLCNDQEVGGDHNTERVCDTCRIRVAYSFSDVITADNNDVVQTVKTSAMNRNYNANGIVVDDHDNAIVVAAAAANQFDRYTEECVGASLPAFVMPNSTSNGNLYVNLKCESSQPSFHRTAHQSPQHIGTANHLSTHNSMLNTNSSGANRMANNVNRLCDGTTKYAANSSNVALFHHSTMPIMKKHERHRRRKVCCVLCLCDVRSCVRLLYRKKQSATFFTVSTQRQPITKCSK